MTYEARIAYHFKIPPAAQYEMPHHQWLRLRAYLDDMAKRG